MAALPEPAARTGTPVRARGAGAPRELALPPAVHVHGGRIAGVVAELSAGHHNFVDWRREYCSLPNSGRPGQEQPTVRTTSDWSRGRIRPDGWLSCICSAQLFLSGSAEIGETAIHGEESRFAAFFQRARGRGEAHPPGVFVLRQQPQRPAWRPLRGQRRPPRRWAVRRRGEGGPRRVRGNRQYCQLLLRIPIGQGLYEAGGDAGAARGGAGRPPSGEYRAQRHHQRLSEAHRQRHARWRQDYHENLRRLYRQVLHVGRRQPDHRPVATEPPHGRQLPRGRGDAPHRPLCTVGATAATCEDHLTRERRKRERRGVPVQQQR